LLALVLSAGTPGWAHAQSAASTEAEVATAPVEFDGTVLYRVRGVSSFPAADRARAISDRLAAVAADPSISVDSLRVFESDGISQIAAGDRPIAAVVDADAALEEVGRPQLAAAHLTRFRQAILDYRAARSPAALRSDAVATAVATAVLAVVVVVLVWFWRWVDRLLKGLLERRIHSVGIQSFEVMRAEQITHGLRGAFLTIRTAAFLAIGLVYIGYVLTQWPSTRAISDDFANFALAPLRVIAGGIAVHIGDLVFLAVLAFVIRVILRLVRLFFFAVGRGDVTLSGFEKEWAEPTYKIIRLLIVAFGIIVAYPYIPGSGSAAFQGVSVFVGIVFSLGSSTAIANIIAGYMLTYRRAFKVGDRVKIGDSYGDVEKVRLQVTHLRSIKNEEFVIPNAEVLSSHVMNYSSLAHERGLILHTEVGIGYETPWRQVEAMLLNAAERTAGLVREPPPFILEKALGDFAVTYELNVYCDNVKAMAALYAELHRNILDVFNEYGVQIMTPAYEGDPEVPKVVPPKDWYTAPAVTPSAPAGRREPSLT
jgi:small-conductance mechanosensitive channel